MKLGPKPFRRSADADHAESPSLRPPASARSTHRDGRDGISNPIGPQQQATASIDVWEPFANLPASATERISRLGTALFLASKRQPEFAPADQTVNRNFVPKQ